MGFAKAAADKAKAAPRSFLELAESISNDFCPVDDSKTRAPELDIPTSEVEVAGSAKRACLVDPRILAKRPKSPPWRRPKDVSSGSSSSAVPIAQNVGWPWHAQVLEREEVARSQTMLGMFR